MAVQISGNDITVPRDGTFTRNVTIGGTLTYEDVTNIDSVGLITARNGISVTGGDVKVAAGIITASTNTDGTTELLTLHADADGTNNGVASIKFVGNAGNHSAFIKGGHTTNGDTILTFHTDDYDSGFNPQERLRIDNTGKVIFTTPGGDDALLIKGDNYTSVRVQSARNSASDHAMFQMLGSRGTNASPTIVQSDDTLGTLSARGYDGNSYASSSNINFGVDGTPGDGDMPGRITFSTAADGSESPIERARITSDGKIGIGTINPAKAIQVGSAVTTAQFQINPHAAGWDLAVTSGDLAPHFQTKFALYSGQMGAGTERFKVDASGATTSPTQPRFWAKSNSAQTLQSDGTTMIRDFGNEIFDTGGCYDGTNKFTAPVNGYYHFGWHIMVEGGNTNGFSYFFGRPTISGVDQSQEVMMPRSGGASYASVTGSHLFYLTAGQYVQIQMRQSGGSNMSVRSDQGYFWGYLAN